MTPERDEFYCGYWPAAPEGYARFVRRGVALMAAVVLGLGVLLTVTQEKAGPGIFEYGVTREMVGQIRELPYPVLFVPRPGITDRAVAYTRYLLVMPGKHGAQAAVAGRDGEWVSANGSVIASEGLTMFELAVGGLHRQEIPGEPRGLPTPPVVALGRFTLTGEVVDSKCYLGVMKPATRTVHRGCAARCLSDGAPPLLLLRDSAGPAAHLLLVGAAGEPVNRKFKQYV